MSVSEQVLNRVHRMRRGEPFPIRGFYPLGSHTSVQKALSRLVKKGEVVRASKGFYVRPKPLPSLPSIKTTTSAEQIAKAWARERGYKLVNQGQDAAYRLGFQTQAPMKTVFWSDGPSREFKVGHQVVEIRHTSKQKLRWPKKPEGILLRGMLVTPPEAVEPEDLKKAVQRLALTPDQTQDIVGKLLTFPMLNKWTSNLITLKELAK